MSAPKSTLDSIFDDITKRPSVVVVGVVNTAMEGQLKNALVSLIAATPDEGRKPSLAVSKAYDAGVTGPNGAPVRYRAFLMSLWKHTPVVARRSALGSIPNHEVIDLSGDDIAKCEHALKVESDEIVIIAGGFDDGFM